MHRALNIAEVVHSIIQYIYPTSPTFFFFPDGKRRNLLNVALTCRAFSDPALDGLWYSMSSLKPLFNILSNFRCSSPDKLMEPLLWGTISKIDLKRVQTYASRIRRYSHTGDNISFFAYMHLLRACGHHCLLPSLACLTWHASLHLPEAADSAETNKALFLISPALREVDITASASIVLHVLNSLQTHAPNVSILKITTRTTPLLSSHFIPAICSFPQLQEIEINIYNEPDHLSASEPFVDISFFTRISSNKTLRHFSLTGMKHLGLRLDLFGTVEFPALKSINLRCPLPSLSPITTLLQHLAFPSLKSLSIELNISSKPGPLEDWYWAEFSNIVKNVTTSSFKELRIFSHSYHPEHAGGSLWKDIVPKISDLDQLSLEVFILKPPILRLLRTDVQKMIKSWPGLTWLELTSCQPFSLGFDVLLDIAPCLPNLRSLTLSMDIRDLPIHDEIPLLGHRLGILQLEILSMTHAGIVMDLVQCVDKIFPKLISWEVKCPNYPNLTAEVTKLLTMLQKARRYEAKRVSLC